MTYANWFSYQTEDFVSPSWEIYRAIRTTQALPQPRLRYGGDRELDNHQVFAWVERVRGEFILRVRHEDRLVEVYNERLDRWEEEHLDDLMATVPFSLRLQVRFPPRPARPPRRGAPGLAEATLARRGASAVDYRRVRPGPEVADSAGDEHPHCRG